MLLGACTTVQERWAEIEGRKVTASGFDQLRFAPLPPETEKTIEIGETILDMPAKILDGPENPRRAVGAVHLEPRLDKPRLVFETATGSDLETITDLFLPTFVFLDEQRSVLSVATTAALTKSPRLDAGRLVLRGRVDVPDRARYAVISSSAEFGTVRVRVPGAERLKLTPTGRIRLRQTDEGYAVVEDSFFEETGSKARLFYVQAIDGVRVHNALVATRAGSQNTGFAQRAAAVVREVPTRPQRFTIRATHSTGAPIHAIASRLAGTFQSVEGTVTFQPSDSKTYVVRGELRPEGSAVWIEDLATGERVTDTIGATEPPVRR